MDQSYTAIALNCTYTNQRLNCESYSPRHTKHASRETIVSEPATASVPSQTVAQSNWVWHIDRAAPRALHACSAGWRTWESLRSSRRRGAGLDGQGHRGTGRSRGCRTQCRTETKRNRHRARKVSLPCASVKDSRECRLVRSVTRTSYLINDIHSVTLINDTHSVTSMTYIQLQLTGCNPIFKF